MTSSVRMGMAAQEKAKKAAQKESENAVKDWKEPKGDQQQHKQIDVGGVSAEASGGDLPEPVKKPAVKKKAAAKAPAKKSGRSGAKVQQDS